MRPRHVAAAFAISALGALAILAPAAAGQLRWSPGSGHLRAVMSDDESTPIVYMPFSSRVRSIDGRDPWAPPVDQAAPGAQRPGVADDDEPTHPLDPNGFHRLRPLDETDPWSGEPLPRESVRHDVLGGVLGWL